MVNGARQSGKSTLVQSAELTRHGRQYLTFDDPGVLGAAKRWLRGVVLYTGTEVIPFAANLHGVPVSHLSAALDIPRRG